ncbi:hypothetical protein BTK97_003658 [Burkholderia multivorans]|nr:hypothetical protein [Burkholderia multivorans]
MAIDTEKMKALAADLRKGSSGRYKWYAMGRDETSYFMDFDWGYDADRWFSDQQKSRAAWIEQEGIHIVKKLFQTELETNASEAADAIDTLLAALEAAAAFVQDVSKQKPERPDYWSSCSQCEHNIDRAQDLLEKQAALSQRQEES